jgi:peptidoglycan/LPS O-acetylase OafA/YrhL
MGVGSGDAGVSAVNAGSTQADFRRPAVSETKLQPDPDYARDGFVPIPSPSAGQRWRSDDSSGGSMAETTRDAPRVAWLDGLRGLAAMQVVLLHYACAFLPGLGFGNPRYIHFNWELRVIDTPLDFLFDGTTAVYLFFIISGVVLTYAFSGQHLTILPLIARRLIRLGLPLAGTLTLAAILFTVLPGAQPAASRLLGISWFGVPLPSPVPVRAIVHQIFVEGLLTGYSEQAPHWLGAILGLAPIQQARNPPLWTLHIEFVGSLLVMALVATRASLGRATYRGTCVVLAVCFLASPLCLFILGHLAAPYLQRAAGGAYRRVLAASCLILGILLSTTTIFSLPPPLLSWLRSPPIGPSIELRNLLPVFGSILVFASVTQLPTLRRSLETPALRWLGKISFSLYLTHFPILFTVTAAAYTAEAAYLPYGASLAVGILAGIPVSLAVAALFERWIDRPAINLSRRIGRSHRRIVVPAAYVPVADFL